jgi:2-C-methyl-D-erythritol 4-phosphate cytidylyltransferase
MTSAIIVAAGKGTRMGPNADKLFIVVAGRPVVAHTWQRFESAACIDEIVLVVRDGMQDAFSDLARRFGFQKKFSLVAGGKERQDSVWNGLQCIAADAEIVAIQDGARPCTSEAIIADTVRAAKAGGAAVAAQRVTDTIKEADAAGFIRHTVDRSRLWSVQTPQSFRVRVIRQALEAARQRGLKVTDDTAACELTGQVVQLIESASPNPKVTTTSDLAYIELLLTRNVH